MRYFLLKKNTIILSFSYQSNQKLRVDEVFDASLLPFFLQKNIQEENFEKWLLKRCIPPGRKGLSDILKVFHADSSLGLSLRSHALSLSDAYWVKPADSGILWEDVNFYANGYSDNIGNCIIRKQECTFENSPDFTTNGVMQKAWRHKKEGDFLFKLGAAPFYQEPFNEVICSQLAAAFPALKAAPYYLTEIDGKSCSVCRNFLTESTELVPASYLLLEEERGKGSSYYTLIRRCKMLQMHNVRAYLESMIAFDYLICNQDRHLGNFGFLQCSNTGVFIGPAPLYDCGNSLWHDEVPEMMSKGEEPSKGFMRLQENQIELVRKFENIDFAELKRMPEMMHSILLPEFSARRADCIVKRYRERIDLLERHKERTAAIGSMARKKEFEEFLER